MKYPKIKVEDFFLVIILATFASVVLLNLDIFNREQAFVYFTGVFSVLFGVLSIYGSNILYIKYQNIRYNRSLRSNQELSDLILYSWQESVVDILSLGESFDFSQMRFSLDIGFSEIDNPDSDEQCDLEDEEILCFLRELENRGFISKKTTKTQIMLLIRTPHAKKVIGKNKHVKSSVVFKRTSKLAKSWIVDQGSFTNQQHS